MITLKQISFFLLAALASLGAHAARPDSVSVFLYTHGNPSDGLKVAYSTDCRTWTKLCDDYSYVKSDYGAWGRDKKMLSTPSCLRYNGKWYAVWQVDENEKQFATTHSADLFLWKPQDYPYAKGVSSVYKPTLTKEKSGFVVRFTTKEGKCFSMTSADFVKWSEPKAISNAEYQ
ncbi:MAG: hypothetical protein HUK07_07120, partial [Bacteroidaceae bacterium]|nr:hypothetical protein [Bacteroidaceae bacterium]